MGFHEIPRRGPGAALGVEMTMALYRSRNGTSLRLILGRDLLDRLEWREDDRLKLLFGNGRDHGRLRLERTRSGGSKLMTPHAKRSGRGCLVFNTQRLPQGTSTHPHSAKKTDFRIVDGAIRFHVPDWFYTSKDQ